MARTSFKRAVLSASILLLVAGCNTVPQETAEKQPPIAPIEAPFDMPQLQRPTFKTDTFNITDFGAV